MKTWQKEVIVVASILGSAVAFSGGKPIEYIGFFAVLSSFCHAQIGFRLSEAEERSTDPARVHCYQWLTRYFCLKEIFWCMYFLGKTAYTGLVGVFIFLLYPVWRRFHKKL